MSTTRTLTVADVATKLNELKQGERLVIPESHFKPVVTMWAQANVGKTLWLDISWKRTLAGPYTTQRVALESSIRGKLKGDAWELCDTFRAYSAPGLTVTIRPMSVEVESDVR